MSKIWDKLIPTVYPALPLNSAPVLMMTKKVVSLLMDNENFLIDSLGKIASFRGNTGLRYIFFRLRLFQKTAYLTEKNSY